MYYEQYGDKKKPTIIFLHGAMAFQSFARQEELKDSFHLIFYTLPGHGNDYKRDFDRNTAISEVANIIKGLNKKAVHIVGFSLGAQLALSMLNKYSVLIDKAVIISPLIDSTETENKILSINTRLVGYSTKIAPLAKIVSMLIGINRDKYPEFKREQKNQRVNKLSFSILQDMLKSENLENIKSVKNPVLLLAGELEYNFFKRSALRLSQIIPNSKLEYYKGAGHNIPYLFYKKFNKDLREFLK
ncbi:MAG: alpha/beta hydrolase [Clostridia bacterium]|nr:alpha/beta hydrolase [Clostridia bacterium]